MPQTSDSEIDAFYNVVAKARKKMKQDSKNQRDEVIPVDSHKSIVKSLENDISVLTKDNELLRGQVRASRAVMDEYLASSPSSEVKTADTEDTNPTRTELISEYRKLESAATERDKACRNTIATLLHAVDRLGYLSAVETQLSHIPEYASVRSYLEYAVHNSNSPSISLPTPSPRTDTPVT